MTGSHALAAALPPAAFVDDDDDDDADGDNTDAFGGGAFALGGPLAGGDGPAFGGIGGGAFGGMPGSVFSGDSRRRHDDAPFGHMPSHLRSGGGGDGSAVLRRNIFPAGATPIGRFASPMTGGRTTGGRPTSTAKKACIEMHRPRFERTPGSHVHVNERRQGRCRRSSALVSSSTRITPALRLASLLFAHSATLAVCLPPLRERPTYLRT